MIRLIDKTLGRWTRHFFFVMVRGYYALFYNVSVSGKHVLQDNPGSLILATHVSRHDGPFIAAMLYSTARVRPTVHWDEYHHKGQWFPMYVSGAIPMSSPKDWPQERRQARKGEVLDIIGKVLANGNSILLFPAGKIRRQAEEIVPPALGGAHEILTARPQTPVIVARLDGIGRFQQARYDLFWSFMGRKKGRRHVTLTLEKITDLDPSQSRDAFNARLEKMLNTPTDVPLTPAG